MSSLPLKWEFPGGKIRPGESVEECLRRELLEEIGIHVDILSSLPEHTHHYPDFSVTLYPYVCTIASGEVIPYEHAAIAWLHPDELYNLDWAEADWPILRSYSAILGEAQQRRKTNKHVMEAILPNAG